MSNILNFDSPAALIVNIMLIVFIIAETYDGFKRGFLESSIKLLGNIAALVGAYLLKGPVSIILYTNLPFFKFDGLFKGISALNIILYEIIAFIIVYVALIIAIKIICKLTGLVEKLLSFIFLFGIPNKILGAVVGFIKGMVILYFIIFIFKFGCNLFNFEVEASLADTIVEIPILKETFGDALNSLDEITVLAREYDNTKNKEEFNKLAIDILLKYNIITEENLNKLIESGKIVYGEEPVEQEQS